MTAANAEPDAGMIDRLVRIFILPIANAIPVLVERGVLLVLYAGLWLAFGFALVTDPAALTRASDAIAGLPLPAQGVVWLLFLPQMAGLWVWGTDWPVALRLVVVAAIAAWNVLVFIPRRPAATAATAS
jgi:hypothetical protein